MSDKQNRVMEILADPECSSLSDQAVAKLCGVTAAFVKRVRNEAQAAPIDSADQKLSDEEASVELAREYYLDMFNDRRRRVTAKVELMTPERAAELLGDTTRIRNRPVSMTSSKRLAGDILNLDWKLNGETVILDESGSLLDGQHRLTAIVETGVAVPILVARGVSAEEEVFRTMDEGHKRTVAHVLDTRGSSNTKAHAAAAMFVWRYLNRTHSLKGRLGGWGITHSRLIKFIDSHPDLQYSVEFVLQYCKRKQHSNSTMSGLHYLCRQNHPDKADWFFRAFLNAEGLEANTPAWALNKRFANQDEGFASHNKDYAAAMVVVAWNHFIKKPDHPCKQVKFQMDQPFPEIL